MFRPNQNCTIISASGRTDVYGQPITSTRYSERCAVVKLITKNQKTAIRADSSASRGNARETVADSLILLARNTRAEIDDLISVSGQTLRIMSMHPRFSVTGELDHYEITASHWSGE